MAQTSSKTTDAFYVYVLLPVSAMLLVGPLIWVWFVGWDCLEWLSVQSWQPIPCRVFEVHLGGVGADVRVHVRYSYQFHDRTFTSSRVSFPRHVAGARGDRALFRELDECRRLGKPFRCYVHPRRPAEAILDRQLYPLRFGWPVMIGLLVAGVGLGTGRAAVAAWREIRYRRMAATAHPESPWLWEKYWKDGILYYSPSGGEHAWSESSYVIAPWGFGLFASACLCDRGGLWTMGVPVVLALSWLVARRRKRWFRHHCRENEAVFTLDSLPGFLGGPLVGTIHTAAHHDSPAGFQLTLRCYCGSTTAWADEQRIPHGIPHDYCTVAIPVLFALPLNAPESGDWQSCWELAAHALAPESTFHASFEVPVFRTFQSRAH
jgi:hypothetical protein